MSPSEVATLIRLMREVGGKVDTLTEKFESHLELESERRDVRKATCPQGETVGQLVIDVNAIAGKQRSMAGDVKGLVEWRRKYATDEAVEDSWTRTIRNLWTEVIKPIVIPVIVALIAIKIGIRS